MAKRTTYTTHPGEGTTKRVCPATATETEAQRARRLGAQAAANRIRVHDNGDGTYTVPSQRKGADGRPVAVYTVTPGAARACTCEAGRWHPERVCAHQVQVQKHQTRKAHEAARGEHTARVQVVCPRCGACDSLVFSFVCWHCGCKPDRVGPLVTMAA